MPPRAVARGEPESPSPGGILVLNAGSSSVKFSLFDDRDPPHPLVRGQVDLGSIPPRFIAHDGDTVIARREWPPGSRLSHAAAIELLLSAGKTEGFAHYRVAAVGHRVVHGGPRLDAPAIIDARLLSALEALIPLAPLHQPHTLTAIRAVAATAPDLPQVACFDTAFHRTQPHEAQSFALPPPYAEEGVKRYGFHGLSYEYVAAALTRCDPRAASGRTVVAHLGNGASLCALAGGRSVATTMGFTALDGLVMGTRCGALDPGVVLHLCERYRHDVASLRHLLYEESGLLGVSGISGDMRVLLNSADPRAAEAVNLFVYRVRRELGSMAAALGGLDALVFTAGIGEHAPEIRARVCRDAAWLGIELDEAANRRGAGRISTPQSRASVWVIPTDEEALIAGHTRRLVTSNASPRPARRAAAAPPATTARGDPR